MANTDFYQKRYDAKILLLAEMDDALIKIMSEGVENATFDTGTYGARQHYKVLTPDKILKDVKIVESQAERYARKLRGGGLVNLRQRRMG